MSEVPTRGLGRRLAGGVRLVVAGALYLCALAFMAVTMAIRVLVYGFFVAVGIELAFAVAGIEPHPIVRTGYWVAGLAILGWSVFRVARTVRSGRRLEAASMLARTREPDDAEASARATLRRLSQTVGLATPALRISESNEPLCYTVRFPTDEPPSAVLERDVGAYRAFSVDETANEGAFDADEPIDAEFAVVLSTGLLSALDDTEVAAVLAHEIAHLRNGDPGLRSVFLVPLAWTEEALPSGGNLVGLLVVGVPALLMVAAAVLALAVFARGREYDADAGAAAITGDPAALASALDRLREDAKRPEEDVRSATVLNVLPTGDDLIDRLVHPPTERRIDRLRGMTVSQDV